MVNVRRKSYFSFMDKISLPQYGMRFMDGNPEMLRFQLTFLSKTVWLD